MKIKSLTARSILDSRAEWTVEATIELANGVRATASVPEGKSTGAAEAHALPASVAVRNINTRIAAAVRGGGRAARAEFKSQQAFDDFLIKLDGTADKRRLGANAILACSIAFARASAMARDVPLWKYIREVYGMPVVSSRLVTRPRLFMNLINGGLHGGSNLDIQEYVIIPRTRTFAESVEIGVQIYNELKMTIERRLGKQATNLGDEGGFAPNFRDNLEPLTMLRAVTKKLKLSKVVDFGMDAAATDIAKERFGAMPALYAKLVQADDFIYLEDPFPENDFAAFAKFTAKYGAAPRRVATRTGKKAAPFWITGDDLTTTNVHRMERAHAEGSVNAVIIKPNQIGSVSEALDAVRAARRYGWGVVASHRSGETNDDFIADFAYGVGADGLKLGAPARGERTAKYNRLLLVEREAR